MTRRFAAAADRNRHDILPMLQALLPAEARVLEIASGSGQHAVHFAPHFAHWQPSDIDPEALDSIAAYREETGLASLAPPLQLDVTAEVWPALDCDAMVSINMLHAAPLACAEGLIAGAGRLLPENGALYLYGPFRIDGQFTSPSNEQFDGWLRGRDPSWGIRDLAQLTEIAAGHQLLLDTVRETPINNFSVLFRIQRP